MILKKRNRRIYAWHSDTHGGHWLGLLNPDTILTRLHDDGTEELWTPDLSATQNWLWSRFTECWSDAISLADGDEIVVGHVGDITHGTRVGKLVPGIIPQDQATIATCNLLPLVSNRQVKQVFLATGTEIHVPGGVEAVVARDLREKTGKGVVVFHQARINMGQEFMDVAHHGAHPGTRDWLRGNVATYYLKSRVYEDRRIGKKPSSLYIRGHFHVPVHVTVNETWLGEQLRHNLAVVPSMSGPTRYAIKRSQSSPVLTVGFVAAEVIDGKLHEVHCITRDKDLRVEI